LTNPLAQIESMGNELHNLEAAIVDGNTAMLLPSFA
jgi:hypothetical protein